MTEKSSTSSSRSSRKKHYKTTSRKQEEERMKHFVRSHSEVYKDEEWAQKYLNDPKKL